MADLPYLNCAGRDERPAGLPEILWPIRKRRGVNYRWVVATHWKAAHEATAETGAGIFLGTANAVFDRFVGGEDLPKLLTVFKALVRCGAFVQDGDDTGVDSWFRRGPRWQEFVDASEPFYREWADTEWRLPLYSLYRICGVLPTSAQQETYRKSRLADEANEASRTVFDA